MVGKDKVGEALLHIADGDKKLAAAFLGYTPEAIRLWLKGERKWPRSVALLVCLMRKAGVTIAEAEKQLPKEMREAIRSPTS